MSILEEFDTISQSPREHLISTVWCTLYMDFQRELVGYASNLTSEQQHATTISYMTAAYEGFALFLEWKGIQISGNQAWKDLFFELICHDRHDINELINFEKWRRSSLAMMYPRFHVSDALNSAIDLSADHVNTRNSVQLPPYRLISGHRRMWHDEWPDHASDAWSTWRGPILSTQPPPYDFASIQPSNEATPSELLFPFERVQFPGLEGDTSEPPRPASNANQNPLPTNPSFLLQSNIPGPQKFVNANQNPTSVMQNVLVQPQMNITGPQQAINQNQNQASSRPSTYMKRHEIAAKILTAVRRGDYPPEVERIVASHDENGQVKPEVGLLRSIKKVSKDSDKRKLAKWARAY